MRKVLSILFLFLVIYSCTDPFIDETKIDLGELSTSTTIKSVTVSDNIVQISFNTTIGAKYSVQIIPFGSEEPIKKEGFTALNETTERVYDLSKETKGYYDLLFIDISGNEVKYPIVVK